MSATLSLSSSTYRSLLCSLPTTAHLTLTRPWPSAALLTPLAPCPEGTRSWQDLYTGVLVRAQAVNIHGWRAARFQGTPVPCARCGGAIPIGPGLCRTSPKRRSRKFAHRKGGRAPYSLCRGPAALSLRLSPEVRHRDYGPASTSRASS